MRVENVGKLVRMYGYHRRNNIGIILRYNPQYNSYTIFWIKNGEICAKTPSDIEFL